VKILRELNNNERKFLNKRKLQWSFIVGRTLRGKGGKKGKKDRKREEKRRRRSRRRRKKKERTGL
jgi:hypothetical protein